MKHAARRSIQRIAAAILVAASSLGFAQTLTEFHLPGMQPTDIDTDPNTGDVYFLDPASQTVNRLSGGTIRQWPPGPCFLTPIDKIAVSNVLYNPAVYFTSIVTNNICILNPSAPPVLQWYPLPFVVNSPRTLSVDPTGNAWFSSTPGAGPEALGSLNPITGIVHLWLLPAVVATPGDAIDGLQFANNQLYFSVTGSLNQICVMLNPAINPSPTNCYPVPFTQPVPIRVNSVGQVYRIAGAGFNRIARLDIASSILTQWGTPSSPDIYLSPVDPPYFTSFTPEVDRLDPTIPGFNTPALPNPVNLYSDYLSAQMNAFNVPWGDFTPAVVNSPLNATTSGAFNIWAATSSTGPLTVDPLGAVWISETAAGNIATFLP